MLLQNQWIGAFYWPGLGGQASDTSFNVATKLSMSPWCHPDTGPGSLWYILQTRGTRGVSGCQYVTIRAPMVTDCHPMARCVGCQTQCTSSSVQIIAATLSSSNKIEEQALLDRWIDLFEAIKFWIIEIKQDFQPAQFYIFHKMLLFWARVGFSRRFDIMS